MRVNTFTCIMVVRLTLQRRYFPLLRCISMKLSLFTLTRVGPNNNTISTSPFPDGPETLRAFQKLKAGKVDRLSPVTRVAC